MILRSPTTSIVRGETPAADADARNRGSRRLQRHGHVKLAASVEFHAHGDAFHDDVVDESDLRRGRVAARSSGATSKRARRRLLLGQAFRMMVEVGNLRALEILSSAAAVIAKEK